jgi:MYXO-CTERM domain-containing protein
MDNPSDCQACSVATGAMTDGTCAPARGGQVCQSGVEGGCFLDSVCQAGNAICPAQQTKPDGTICTAGSCQGGNCRDEATLVLTMVPSPAVTTKLNPVAFAITVLNNGPSTATQFQLQLTSPNGATLQNATGTGLTCQSSAGTQANQTIITCTGADLPSGSSVMLMVSAVPPYTSPSFSVTGTATSSTFDPGTSNTATVTVNNSNPQTPVLAGGGFGCSLSSTSAGTAAPGLLALAIALLALLFRRRLAGR